MNNHLFFFKIKDFSNSFCYNKNEGGFMTKKQDNFLLILYLLFPFIDFITGILTWNHSNLSIGLLIKGLFLLYTVLYLWKNEKNKKIFLLMGFYFIIYFLYIILKNKNIVVELTNLIKIFYFPILILFFSRYENEKMTKKTLVYIFLIYLLLYLVPFFLGIGHNAHEIAPNRELYLSYFYIGNELANIFIMLIPIAISFLLESNSYLLKVFFAFLFLCILILMGTKAFYLSTMITVIYFIFIKRKKIYPFIKKNYLKTLVTVLVVLIAIIVYIPRLDFTKSFKATLQYYNVNSVSQVFTLENIDNVLFNSRISYLKNIHKTYLDGNSLEKLLGLGKEKIAANKEIEIDVFDIFYSIGIIGFAFYLFLGYYAWKQSKLQGVYKYAFILIIAVSCFTGHVLMSPFVSTILALFFLVNKNKNRKKQTSILLVSNMFPNLKYPHYGVFVENVDKLLKENNFLVDEVVMSKTDNKILKAISYCQFYIRSFWLAVWNNYDYIYVHFISHSTLGVYLPYLCSNNTKLILNVHGNDVIADYEFEYKNEQRSKVYLKSADKVIVPSKYFQKLLIEKYNVPKEKIVIYPSGGVNVDKFKKVNKKLAIKNANLKDGVKYFGYVSRIEKDKGYDTLILAINELKKQKKLNKIKFLIVGSGNEEQILDEMINKYKLEKYIERKPLVSQDEIINIYNAIEALIYPTRRKSESLGLTGLEAMACEALVIGSNEYGPGTYLVNNKNSLTFAATDYKELAKKIEEVLKMKAKDRNVITKSARLKSEEYSIENTKGIILNVFK